MSIKDLQEFDATIFFQDFGGPVTYEGSAITAVFEFGENRAAGNTFVNDGQAARASLWVSTVDVPEWREQDKVVIDGVTWRVAREIERSPGLVCLEITGRQSAW